MESMALLRTVFFRCVKRPQKTCVLSFFSPLTLIQCLICGKRVVTPSHLCVQHGNRTRPASSVQRSDPNDPRFPLYQVERAHYLPRLSGRPYQFDRISGWAQFAARGKRQSKRIRARAGVSGLRSSGLRRPRGSGGGGRLAPTGRLGAHHQHGGGRWQQVGSLGMGRGGSFGWGRGAQLRGAGQTSGGGSLVLGGEHHSQAGG